MRKVALGLASAAMATALMIGGAGIAAAAPGDPVSGTPNVTDATGSGGSGTLWRWPGDRTPFWNGGTIHVGPEQPPQVPGIDTT